MTEIDDGDAFFACLPETAVRNMEEMDLFANYVKSDMLIEVMRFLKYRAATTSATGQVTNTRLLR
jgi:hypothetical protein